jgi:hypothetical protein
VLVNLGGVAEARAVPAAASTPVVLTITDSGSYSDSWTGSAGDNGSETVNWTVTERDSFSFDSATGRFTMTAHTSNVQASGSQTATFPSNPSNNVSCTLSGGGTSWAISVGKEHSQQPGELPFEYSVTVGPPELSGSGQNCGSPYECNPQSCIGSPNGTPQQVQAWQGAFNVGLQGPSSGLPVRKDAGGSLSSSDDSTTISEQINICEGTVSVCTGASSHPAPTPLSPEKLAAQKDFKAALPGAVGPCLHLASGLGVLATGGVWVLATAAVPGGLASGQAVLLTGGVMIAATTPLCGPKLRRLIDDYRIFNDPPAGNENTLATVAPTPSSPHLHACAGLKGKASVFCLKLRGLVEKLISAERHTAYVDDAMLTTVDRASGAERSHNQAALARQLHYAKQLRGKLAAALAAEASIGRAIKRLLPAGAIDASQASTAIAYVQRRLARAGISKAKVTAIDPAAATPTAEDPIKILLHP